MKMKYLLILLLLIPISVIAYQPKPISFEFNSEGEVFGILEDGTQFSQTNIATDLGIRLQKFQWSEGFWYISNKGIIEADYDLQAFSIYLVIKE